MSRLYKGFPCIAIATPDDNEFSALWRKSFWFTDYLALLNQDIKKVWCDRHTRSTPCKSLRDLIWKFHMDIHQR